MTEFDKQLWSQYQSTRSIEDRNRLVAHYYPMLCRIAKFTFAFFRPQHCDWDDLANECVPRLIRLVESFEPTRGLAFSTFAAPLLRMAMIDAFRSSEWASRCELQKLKRSQSKPKRILTVEDIEKHDTAVEDTTRDVDRDREFWVTVCKPLSVRDRSIVMLRFRDELPCEAIAKRLGFSQTRVYQILNKSLETLRLTIDLDDLVK